MGSVCCSGGLRSYLLKRIWNVRIQASRPRRERVTKSSSSEKGGVKPRIKIGFKRKQQNDGDVLVNHVTLLCTRRKKKKKQKKTTKEAMKGQHR